MSFISRLFNHKKTAKRPPDVEFGRFSDSYKSEVRYDAWDRAIEYFESGEYFQSFRNFFDYLTDDYKNNVSYAESDDQLTFTILQGSKKITGYADIHTIKAEGKIAHASELSIGYMRRLIESNYNLKYGRYCLDDDQNLTIVFDSITLDASPYKLYYGLKEIALAADKQDDLLIEEFEMLQPINNTHVIDISEKEKDIKIAFLRQKTEAALDYIKNGKLNPVQYAGGITYMLLDTIYRLDFLIRPEGYTMEAFERMHRNFFAADGFNNQQKNHQLLKELMSLQERPDEKIRSELYRTISTFGMLGVTNHERLRDLIQGELENMVWYAENGYVDIALSVPGYIVGHALFNYSLPEPDKDLFMLYYQIMESDYFTKLGFELDYLQEGKINRHAVRDSIGYIVQTWEKKYPKLNPDLNLLKYGNLVQFAGSYLQMMASLDLTKVMA
ncbi:MAG: hypothetical protein KDC53_05505 [Saprospiraceae bacterium]|nr:hypothetical protein [Saprospiraceae bacterium]